MLFSFGVRNWVIRRPSIMVACIPNSGPIFRSSGAKMRLT